jgi:preprotein translocase subunit YajC
MDTLILAATKASSTSSSSSYTSFLLIIVLIAVMMLFMFRSSRRRQQSAQQTRSQLVNGAKVRTVHGIYGTVRDTDDQNVMVEVAPGVHIKMLKQAVGTVLPDDTPDGVLNTMPDASGSSNDETGQQADGDASTKQQSTF